MSFTATITKMRTARPTTCLPYRMGFMASYVLALVSGKYYYINSFIEI